MARPEKMRLGELLVRQDVVTEAQLTVALEQQKKSGRKLGRVLIDPVDARIRRWFIREFVRSDVERSAGLRFDRRRMIAADKVLVAYLDWLRPLHR